MHVCSNIFSSRTSKVGGDPDGWHMYMKGPKRTKRERACERTQHTFPSSIPCVHPSLVVFAVAVPVAHLRLVALEGQDLVEVIGVPVLQTSVLGAREHVVRPGYKPNALGQDKEKEKTKKLDKDDGDKRETRDENSANSIRRRKQTSNGDNRSTDKITGSISSNKRGIQ